MHACGARRGTCRPQPHSKGCSLCPGLPCCCALTPVAVLQIVNAEKAASAARQLASEVKDLQATVTAALKRKQAEGQALQEQLTRSVVERARLEEALQEAEEQV